MDVEKAAYDLQQKYSKRMEKKMQGKPQLLKLLCQEPSVVLL